MTVVFPENERPAPRLVHYTGRQRGADLPHDVAHLSAEDRLAKILFTGRLRAFPVPGTADIPVICASDTSPADLEAAFRVGLNARGPAEPWALVLHREGMWGSGARPVLYADSVDSGLIRAALAANHPRSAALVLRTDLLMYRSDWTHEREWRWVARENRWDLAVWPQLDAVIVGRHDWTPPDVASNPDARRVERWWWNGAHLVHDGMMLT